MIAHVTRCLHLNKILKTMLSEIGIFVSENIIDILFTFFGYVTEPTGRKDKVS